jgi:hypothetical protein
MVWCWRKKYLISWRSGIVKEEEGDKIEIFLLTLICVVEVFQGSKVVSLYKMLSVVDFSLRCAQAKNHTLLVWA